MSSDLITLDDGQGSTARIRPDRGFNCYSLRLATSEGPQEVLWADPEFATGNARPSGSGIPLLFPFAGRIRGGEFEFDGRHYKLPAGDGRGNAIHGFVLDRPWQIESQSARRVVGVFHASKVDPTINKLWPSDFRLTVSYELIAGRLISEISAQNVGSERLPFWFGTHPYFRVPLGERGRADDCVITVPTRSRWELVDLLPTGERLQVSGSLALGNGVPFRDTKLDDVFGDLQAGGRHELRTEIRDPASGRSLEMLFDDSFQECVVYNPPHRQAICIEPYSAVPDAFVLASQGIETGLRVLAPGEGFSAKITIGWKG